MVLVTVDREILTLKIICVKNFRVDKFLRIRSILEIFLHKMFYSRVKSQPQNYFNSDIFPIYGSCHHES